MKLTERQRREMCLLPDVGDTHAAVFPGSSDFWRRLHARGLVYFSFASYSVRLTDAGRRALSATEGEREGGGRG